MISLGMIDRLPTGGGTPSYCSPLRGDRRLAARVNLNLCVEIQGLRRRWERKGRRLLDKSPFSDRAARVDAGGRRGKKQRAASYEKRLRNLDMWKSE